MHGPTEERTTRALEAYERAGQHCAAVSRVIGITDVAVHDDYFGDDVGEPYRVRAEERAAGIPLVGDPMSRILRVPIGLGQNLFALHPLAAAGGCGRLAGADATAGSAGGLRGGGLRAAGPGARITFSTRQGQDASLWLTPAHW